MALHPQGSQVVTLAPDGSAPRWLGTLGHVTGLKYSFTCPGGCDQMSATLQVPARYRTDALNPGRIVQVIRGLSVCWDGKLDEPLPAGDGWAIAAHGSGTFGADFMATYSGAWPGTSSQVPDKAVNDAIGRGLRWVNPGVNGVAGIYLGQPVDPGAQSVTDLLNLVCSKGGLTWYVSCRPRGNVLSVFPLPTTVNRLLVSDSPVPRTLGGDINTLWLRYEINEDSNAGVPASYGLTSATLPASITAHGAMEDYDDLSSVGLQSAGSAQAVGNQILKRYVRASFGGPFTVRYGQLLTTGGTPVDLGAEQAGGVCRVLLTDYGYGGEVSAAPVQFVVGAYEYDDQAQTAAVTPFQSLNLSLSGLIGAAALNGPTKADKAYRARMHRQDWKELRQDQRQARRDRRRKMHPGRHGR